MKTRIEELMPQIENFEKNLVNILKLEVEKIIQKVNKSKEASNAIDDINFKTTL